MGNSSTKEHRSPHFDGGHEHRHRLHRRGDSHSGPASPPIDHSGDRLVVPVYSSRNGRGSRPEFSFLGIGTSSTGEAELQRRETKQEREARKLAKERADREVERARSMREEHIDGGFCVTQGVYVGTEDFNKNIVRQLMIERRLAPFWRGLSDFKSDWVEHQLIAAARGLPIPAADAMPLEEPPAPNEPARSSTPVTQNLMVPITQRSQSHDSNTPGTTNLSSSPLSFSLPGAPSPLNPSPSPNSVSSSSPLRTRAKTLTTLATTLRSSSQTDLSPREIQLPPDPYVNGQLLELFLYKNAEECPICFVYYPPYINKTRCCDQAICSECFVQIKRPDPHIPEQHHGPGETPNGGATENELVSEPSFCPYCTTPEFGVTYEPPPFRRGLVYAHSHPGAGGAGGAAFTNLGSAMSSSSSLNSGGNLTPGLSSASASMGLGGTAGTAGAGSAAGNSRRRATSLSANDVSVITTDRIRPDWSARLQNARNHAARRSAAATALHTAAYVLGSATAESSRGLVGGRSSRFGGRARGGSNSPANGTGSGSATPATPGVGERQAPFGAGMLGSNGEGGSGGGGGGGNYPASVGGRRRSRMDDLEDMMMLEAIRQSLAEEADRKRKEDALSKKEAKKREKETRKEEKRARKSGAVYTPPGGGGTAAAAGSAGGSGNGSASGSALSLLLPGMFPGMGRKRGNSGSSVLREATNNGSSSALHAPSSNSALAPASGLSGEKDKGKSVDRGEPPSISNSTTTQATPSISINNAMSRHQLDGGAPQLPPLDLAGSVSPSNNNGLGMGSAMGGSAPSKPSHLRTMSNTSSPASSIVEDSGDLAKILSARQEDADASVGLLAKSPSVASDGGGIDGVVGRGA